MITVYYAVCSERNGKPVVRGLYASKAEAETALLGFRRADVADPEGTYWLAEVGKEAESWLRFFADNVTAAPSGMTPEPVTDQHEQ